MSFVAKKLTRKLLSSHAQQYEPEDPHYFHETDAQGRQKRKIRPVPPGLSKKDEKILRKLRKRAHYLDKGVSLCGFRVGWTFFIGFIPLLGDIINVLLNYNLIVKLAKKLDLPESILTKMYMTNAVAAGVGFIPLAGDVLFAIIKPNSRNAHLVEAFLVKRGEKNLAGAANNAQLTNAEIDNIIDNEAWDRTATPQSGYPAQPPNPNQLPPRPTQKTKVR